MKKATHQATKEHNTTLVLKTIYHEDQISRADIARATSLTRTTVSEIVTDLIGSGLVKEQAPQAWGLDGGGGCRHVNRLLPFCSGWGGGRRSSFP